MVSPITLYWHSIPSEPHTPAPENATTTPMPLNFTTHSDLAPDITPCDSPYLYKIYKAANYDCMAMENTESLMVEIYKWYDTEDGLVRNHRNLTLSDFEQFEFYDDFFFVGYTLPSKLLSAHLLIIM